MQPRIAQTEGMMVVLKQTRKLAVMTTGRNGFQPPSELAKNQMHDGFLLAAKIAPVMIWMTDHNTCCVYVNEGWLRFTGRTFETQLGDGWMDGVHLDDLNAMRSTYQDACDRREPFQINYRVRRHDGEYRWILDTGVPRFAENRLFAGYVGSCIDVTERRLAEEALMDLEGRLSCSGRGTCEGRA